MGLITGKTEASQSSGHGFMGKLSAVTSSMFSKKKGSATPQPEGEAHPPPPPTTEKPTSEETPSKNAPELTEPGTAHQEAEVTPHPHPPVGGHDSAASTSKNDIPSVVDGTTGEAAAHTHNADTVDPNLKAIAFDVCEPSLGASVTGHVLVLEGSCYVWAGTEGSATQGSLSAAVGTRFDGGTPTATPLLSGAAAGNGGAGAVSVSMAQRLCKRTGKMVFVSCDLSEDSQILVAAVEAKVVALLKAER